MLSLEIKKINFGHLNLFTNLITSLMSGIKFDTDWDIIVFEKMKEMSAFYIFSLVCYEVPFLFS